MLTEVSTLLKKYPSASILVTGHSHGAALATHAALDIKLEIANADVKLYNFGSPRIGNEKFAKFFD